MRCKHVVFLACAFSDFSTLLKAKFAHFKRCKDSSFKVVFME